MVFQCKVCLYFLYDTTHCADLSKWLLSFWFIHSQINEKNISYFLFNQHIGHTIALKHLWIHACAICLKKCILNWQKYWSLFWAVLWLWNLGVTLFKHTLWQTYTPDIHYIFSESHKMFVRSHGVYFVTFYTFIL